MGHLLSSAIKMQSSAPATASLTLYSELGTTTTNRARWFKNGVLVGTFTGISNVTLNAGDTFYVTAINTSGAQLYISKNGVYVYANSSSSTMTSTTQTASAGDVFSVEAYLGF